MELQGVTDSLDPVGLYDKRDTDEEDVRRVHKPYETPLIYVILHIIIGAAAYVYPILVLFIVAYQLLQWILECRFFLFTWEIKEGNSFRYTCYKLMQYAVGYGAMYLMHQRNITSVNDGYSWQDE